MTRSGWRVRGRFQHDALIKFPAGRNWGVLFTAQLHTAQLHGLQITQNIKISSYDDILIFGPICETCSTCSTCSTPYLRKPFVALGRGDPRFATAVSLPMTLFKSGSADNPVSRWSRWPKGSKGSRRSRVSRVSMSAFEHLSQKTFLLLKIKVLFF